MSFQTLLSKTKNVLITSAAFVILIAMFDIKLYKLIFQSSALLNKQARITELNIVR
jgi:hypothetical protein